MNLKDIIISESTDIEFKQRISFDALSTKEKFDDASFTLFKSIFKKVSKKQIESKKDFQSFGMIDENGNLTYAGLLLSDECNLLQSRMFCTRWNGKVKGSIHNDALDGREYNGNIIMLLRDASSFVKNHNRKAWNVEGLQRKEFIDYPEGAVREAIVNALVHRDYGIIGSEIHIDMYDDRLEIVSSGGIGRNIQEIDIDDLVSERRNPIIADMFSQLDYMERRGSGLRRIKDFFIDESYVEFRSNKHNFFVVMKNQYYIENGELQQEQEEL
jgi:ATP-dependent DNA helicase RecG